MRAWPYVTGFVFLLGVSPLAVRGDCPIIDFENLAVGTFVTNQYSGVTFSAPPNSCGGSPVIQPIIVSAPAGGTSSGTRVLGVQNGCPDFNPDYLRMVFVQGQTLVSFTLGDAGAYQVRAFTTTSGSSGLFFNQTITIGGAAGTGGVHRLVEISRPAGDMRRVEVQNTISSTEYIDDLLFNVDTTPPTALITTPGWGDCVCNLVSVQGVACDSDGAYGFDRLEYQPLGAAVTDPWTQIGQFFTPLCTAGTLYTWNTTGVPHGNYKLRLTVQNACGLIAQDWREVRVQKEVPTPDIRQPVTGAVRAGAVVIDGSVEFQCFDHYRVQYRPVSGGTFQDVDPAMPLYTQPIETDPLAVWNTASGPAAVADGDYRIRVITTDVCNNNSPAATRDITVDNTPPTAVIDSPLQCAFVEAQVPIMGTATDNNFDRYTLHYIGGAAETWTPILNTEATTPVANGLLAVWNTSGLPYCSYVIRLRVVSDAINPSGDQVVTDAYVTVIAGELCPVDLDGDTDEDLADYARFQNCFDGPQP
jgi:hypothetical protein